MQKIKNISYLTIVLATIQLVGCASNPVDSTPQYHNPPAAIKEKMKSIMPIYEPWIGEVEEKFADKGELPTQQDIDWAKQLGIKNINKIRIIKTEYFPMPQDGELFRELELLEWGSPYEDVRNMGYIIFVRPANDSPKIRAEQIALISIMEDIGRSRFLYRYLVEQRADLSKERRPLILQSNQLAKCAPINKTRFNLGCRFGGIKSEHQQQFEEEQKKAEKSRKKALKEEEEKEKRFKNEINNLQKDNLLEQEIIEEMTNKNRNYNKNLDLTLPLKPPVPNSGSGILPKL